MADETLLGGRPGYRLAHEANRPRVSRPIHQDRSRGVIRPVPKALPALRELTIVTEPARPHGRVRESHTRNDRLVSLE